MILKRIHGKTLSEAIGKAQRECGKDALLVETKQTDSGYELVAARPNWPRGHRAATSAPSPRLAVGRGFAKAAQPARRFGISQGLLHLVEEALIGTRVDVAREGDPALPSVAARVLRSLIATTSLDSHRLVALVGPTGVGKTTTIAKLAAQAARERGESVVLVTVDTWRVAGVEQLRSFAELIGVPCEVAFTALALEQILAKHSKADKIFVDTTGRSPFDRPALAALRKTLAGRGVACALCLPAATRRSDAEAILDTFSSLAPNAAILTKWDETAIPGEALSALVERGLALSHVTTGQNVPQDLVLADAGALAATAFDLAEAPV